MMKRRFALLTLALGIVLSLVPNGQAQETVEQPNNQEAKDSLEKKALTLLEQVATESGQLRLPENRIRLQMMMGDMLWPHNEARARALFDAAAAALLELRKNAQTNRRSLRRGYDEGEQSALQLRQQLLMTVAEHNAQLAYQLLQTTRLPVLPTNTPYNREAGIEANLEQTLLMQIALTDPQLALKNAEAMLDKGQYSYSLMQIIAGLQTKDKDAAARLIEKLLKQLQSENLLAKPEASYLAMTLLQGGPRLPENATASESSNTKIQTYPGGGTKWLTEAAFRNLLEIVVNTALKGTSAFAAALRGGTTPDRQESYGVYREQEAARSLLMSVQSLLPHIEKYVPTKLAAVRQKVVQMGIPTYQPAKEFTELMQNSSSERLLAAAPTAPDYMQTGLYHQAAMKAIEEGNTERAQQIIKDHIEGSQQASYLKMIESRKLSTKSAEMTIESVRLSLARLPTDEERLELIIELANQAEDGNPKLALQILEEALRLVAGRASSYEDLDDQLQVAQAFTELEPSRSFEILDAGIARLNELFPAAQALNGFEVNLFKDGEMLLSSGNELAEKVNEFAEQIAALAAKDFDRAVVFAEKFQLPEARLLVRLTIAKELLDKPSATPDKEDKKQPLIIRGRRRP